MDIEDIVIKATDAARIRKSTDIQTLWSGYGIVRRFELEDCSHPSVVVKHINPPPTESRGKHKNPAEFDKRKLRSYRIETAWYGEWSRFCDKTCRIPECLGTASEGNEIVIILENLLASGYSVKTENPSREQIAAALSWLANFHAVFMAKEPKNLWKTGSFWHLKTRAEELKALEDPALKEAAHAIDRRLNGSPFQTFVHGDAKTDNLCFTRTGNDVAAVDFQYVGGGCGMKDVAYFMGSCFFEEQCAANESFMLDLYFRELRKSIRTHCPGIDAGAVEADWRSLFPFAWTDFYRFLKGWKKVRSGPHSYSERMKEKVLTELNGKSPM
jgi:thiamine kinase-like enzyme